MLFGNSTLRDKGETQAILTSVKFPNKEMLPLSGTKRPLSSSASTSTTNEVEIAINKTEGEPKNKKIIKKAKKSVGKSEESTAIPSISEITEKLEPAREHLLHNAQKYPLDFEISRNFCQQRMANLT